MGDGTMAGLEDDADLSALSRGPFGRWEPPDTDVILGSHAQGAVPDFPLWPGVDGPGESSDAAVQMVIVEKTPGGDPTDEHKQDDNGSGFSGSGSGRPGGPGDAGSDAGWQWINEFLDQWQGGGIDLGDLDIGGDPPDEAEPDEPDGPGRLTGGGDFGSWSPPSELPGHESPVATLPPGVGLPSQPEPPGDKATIAAPGLGLVFIEGVGVGALPILIVGGGALVVVGVGIWIWESSDNRPYCNIVTSVYPDCGVSSPCKGLAWTHVESGYCVMKKKHTLRGYDCIPDTDCLKS